jgi:hypothetical protein
LGLAASDNFIPDKIAVFKSQGKMDRRLTRLAMLGHRPRLKLRLVGIVYLKYLEVGSIKTAGEQSPGTVLRKG